MIPLIPVISALISTVPTIASLIGGETTGRAAAQVISIAETIAGKKGRDAVTAINADPALALDFEKACLANSTEILRLQIEDLKDARSRDIEIRKLNSGKNRRADVLAYGASFFLFVFTTVLLFVKFEEGGTHDLLMILLGALIVIVKDVYGFEFGSSRGSKDKDEK